MMNLNSRFIQCSEEEFIHNNKHLSVKELAAITGRSETGIRDVMKRDRIKTKFRSSVRWTDEELEFLRENAKEMYVDDMAELFDRKVQAIYDVCRNHNIEYKKRIKDVKSNIKVVELNDDKKMIGEKDMGKKHKKNNRLSKLMVDYIIKNVPEKGVNQVASELGKKYSHIKYYADKYNLECNVNKENIEIIRDEKIECKDNNLIAINKRYGLSLNESVLDDIINIKISIGNKLLDDEVLDILENMVCSNDKIIKIKEELRNMRNKQKEIVNGMKLKLNDEIMNAVNKSEYDKVNVIVEDIKVLDLMINKISA